MGTPSASALSVRKVITSAIFLVGIVIAAPVSAAGGMRVCADPYNLPFSNQKGRGFENMLAQMLAEDQGVSLDYEWTSQARGSLRAALAAHLCDVILGVPWRPQTPGLSEPYYRSRWVFVTRADRNLELHSLADDRLATLHVGARRDPAKPSNSLVSPLSTSHETGNNVRSFPMHTARPSPNAIETLVDAVTFGDIDVAVSWGPAASYFVERSVVPLRVDPIDDTGGSVVQAVSMAVRPDDTERLNDLNGFLHRRAADIRQLLLDYHVPLVEAPGSRASTTADST